MYIEYLAILSTNEGIRRLSVTVLSLFHASINTAKYALLLTSSLTSVLTEQIPSMY